MAKEWRVRRRQWKRRWKFRLGVIEMAVVMELVVAAETESEVELFVTGLEMMAAAVAGAEVV